MVMSQHSSSYSWQDASASPQAFSSSNSYDTTDASVNALYGGGYVGQSQSALYPVHSDQRSSSGLEAALGARTSTASSLQSALRPRAQQSVFLSNISTHTNLSPFSSLNSEATGEGIFRHSSPSDGSGSASHFVHPHGYSGLNAPAQSLSPSAQLQMQTESHSPASALSWSGESPTRDHDFNVGMYKFPSPVPFEQEPESVSMHLSDASDISTAHPSPTSTIPSHPYYTPSRLSLPPSSESEASPSRSPKHSSTRVKAEPDLDTLDLEHPPGPPGSHFVMETPYPYTYTTRRKASNGLAEHGNDSQGNVSGQNQDHTDGEIHLEGGYVFPDPNAHEPHSLTAPLRAVNASVEMRACMGVFRLDPFAQLNGVALRCGNAFNSGPGISSTSGGGKKGKGKKGKGKKASKRKRAGSDFAELLEDEVEEDEDEEDSQTWDGEQAGPLKFPPALIQFQLYFEGMMLEEAEEATNNLGSDIDDPETRYPHQEAIREADSRDVRRANAAKGKQREYQTPRRAFEGPFSSRLEVDTERKFEVGRHDHGRNPRLHIRHGDMDSSNDSPNSPFPGSPSHSPHTSSASRAYSSHIPYLDHSGNVHNAISPAPPQSSLVRIQNPDSIQGPGQGQRSVSASIQQLRTQAALRAVSSHSSQQSQNPSQRQQDVRSYRGEDSTSGPGMHVNFTPTPASVAADMHAGFLTPSGPHYSQQQQQQQHQQQVNRMRASSVASNQSLSGQGYSSYNSSLPSHMQASQSGISTSSSSHVHTGYGSITQNNPSIYANLAGAVASGSVTPASIPAHGHRYTHVRGSEGAMLERRWNDTLQKVQG